MISQKKNQLVIVLILACICTPLLGQEPNEGKTQLRLKVSNDIKPWVRDHKNNRARGPIKPTHVAELLIEEHYRSRFSSRVIREILETSAARGMSAKQREFLTKSDAMVWTDFGGIVKYHDQLRLYAVSEDDAKKMVEAFVEVLTNRAKEEIQRLLERKRRTEGKIAEAAKLPEKEAEVEAEQIKLDQHIKSSPYLTANQALEAIPQFNNMLSTLSVEIKGIEAKLQAIEPYIARKKAVKSDRNEVLLAKLEQMQIEQFIELEGAKAKLKTAGDLRSVAEEVVQHKERLEKVQRERAHLDYDLAGYKTDLVEIERRLANPTPKMVPPKVYENKVTIYPVRVDE